MDAGRTEMSTTTMKMKLFSRSPFAYVETTRVLTLAFRIERMLEQTGPSVLSGHMKPDRFSELKQKLRRTIDELADLCEELEEEVA